MKANIYAFDSKHTSELLDLKHCDCSCYNLGKIIGNFFLQLETLTLVTIGNYKC
jgi:hypothetical protein